MRLLGFGAVLGWLFFWLSWFVAYGQVVGDGGKVEHAAGDVDGGDADGDFLAYAVRAGVDETLAACGGTATVRMLVEGAADVIGAHEALRKKSLAANEDAEVGDRGDDGFGFFADAVGEQLQEFDTGQFTFGFGGVLLHEVAVLAQLGELVEVGKVPSGFLGESAGEVGLEQAVDGEVGVAADGAGEVAVMFGSQGVVGHGSRAVLGTLHALEDGQVDDERFGFAGDAVEQVLQAFAVDVFGDGVATDVEDAGAFTRGQSVRFGVDTPQEGDAEAVEESGDGFVGFEHEHFDHGVGKGAAFGVGVDDVALVVVDQFGIGQVEGEHAVVLAAFLEGAGEGFHFADELDEGLGEVRGFALENEVDLVVGEAAGGADEAVGEAGFLDATGGVELDVGGFDEAVLAFLEGADTVAEDFGEHGYDVPGEVGAVGALPSFLVEVGVVFHKGSDVGDVDTEEPMAFGQLLQADGVVEVAGVGGIDGDNGVGADVLAAGLLRVGQRFKFLGGLSGLLEGGAAEFFGEVVSSQDAGKFGAGLAAFAEHFEDDAFGAAVGGRILNDFDAEFIARLGVFGGGVVDGDQFGHASAVGLDEPIAALAEEGADDFVLASFEDFDDAAVETRHAGCLAAADDTGDDAVAANGVEALARRYKEVAFEGGLFGPDEAEASAGGFKRADEAIAHAGQGDVLAWTDDELALRTQAFDGFDKGVVVAVGDVK